MSPEPTIRINVDVTNPGQYFACCGLLELADRLWDGAEGWFDESLFKFYIACDGDLVELLENLVTAQINSSLSDPEIKRLGTLLSANKSKLTDEEKIEKSILRDRWRVEWITIEEPYGIRIDWWRDIKGNRTELKTWAAKQMLLSMLRTMQTRSKTITETDEIDGENLFQKVSDNSIPFYFDSDLGSCGASLDVGFSVDKIASLKIGYSPILEILSFIGLQRFRPVVLKSGELKYATWNLPLFPGVAAAAAAGVMENSNHFSFKMFDRSEYMKSFVPSKPFTS